MADSAYAQYTHPTMPAPVREYDIIVRQEPKQARMCGVGGKADRRPIDPPPIVQLRVRDVYPTSPTSPHPQSHSLNFLQNPYYFMFASLARVDTDDELHLLNDGKTRYTTGSVVSSLYHLKDTENGGEDAGFFVFPDLSVRTEGSYRLKLTLFEVVGSHVQFCKSVYSRPFYVYTAKKFPGMEESTPLSMSLSDQGIKIRIRKDVRNRKRALENADDDEEIEEEEEEGAAGAGGADSFVDPSGQPPTPIKESPTASRGDGGGAITGGRNTRGGGGNKRKPTGARFASDLPPPKSRKSTGRPAKRQRTQGGTVIDLSQNSVQFPAAVASIAGTGGGHSNAVSTPGGDNTGNASTSDSKRGINLVETPVGPDGAPDWDYLPEPSIPGGEPLKVLEHPALKLDPRLKHTIQSGSAGEGSPASNASAIPGTTSGTGGGGSKRKSSSGAANAVGGGNGSSGESTTTVGPERSRKNTLTQMTPTQSHSQPHHQHSSSGSYPTNWSSAPQIPQPPQALEYHSSARSGVATGSGGGGGMSTGPGGGSGIPLPPLQIPQRHSSMGQPMSGHPHYSYSGPGPSSAVGGMASPQLPSASSMHHPLSSSMGHAPSHSHGREGHGYGYGGMMMPPMQTHPPSYLPDTPQSYPPPQHGGHMHPPMALHPQNTSQMGQGYHMHSHSLPQSMPPGPPPGSSGPGPSPSTYSHHGHHLSDPHIHAHGHSISRGQSHDYPPPSHPMSHTPHSHSHGHSHSHSGTYDYPPSTSYPSTSGDYGPSNSGEYGERNEYGTTSPAMMTMTPVSPSRIGPGQPGIPSGPSGAPGPGPGPGNGTPLSAHPPHGHGLPLPPPAEMYSYPGGSGHPSGAHPSGGHPGGHTGQPGREGYTYERGGYSHTRAEGYGHGHHEGPWNGMNEDE